MSFYFLLFSHNYKLSINLFNQKSIFQHKETGRDKGKGERWKGRERGGEVDKGREREYI